VPVWGAYSCKAKTLLDEGPDGHHMANMTKRFVVGGDVVVAIVNMATCLFFSTHKIELLVKILCIFWFIVSFYIMYASTYG